MQCLDCLLMWCRKGLCNAVWSVSDSIMAATSEIVGATEVM